MSGEKLVIGLIAGGKQFPVLVAQGIKQAGHTLVVVTYSGHSNPEVIPYADAHRELKLGKLGKLISFFKENGVQRVLMAGTIDKPKVMDLRYFDMRALKLIIRLASRGDSALLGALAAELDREGMPVDPPHLHVPGLLTPEGVLTRRKPTLREQADIAYGYQVAKELGRLDIGQCVVVREGVVAAVEALEGTDRAIRRGCELGGPEAVVIKVFKPSQEERADLPSAGLETVATMAGGKATCLVMEAGKSLLFDQEATIRAANKAGVSIIGLTPALLADYGKSTES